MHILLININPVVSRLISLCVRENHITLEEIHNANANSVVQDTYDIVFVDEASYTDEIKELLKHLLIRKRVFLSTHDILSNEIHLFDTIIKKPFLPSQIIAVLESLEKDNTLEEDTAVPSIFPLASEKKSIIEIEEPADEIEEEEQRESIEILDSNEIEKIKALLDMEDEVEEVEHQEYEDRKREVITQQLISDGLEIVDEDQYVEELSKKRKKKKSKVKKSNKEKKKKEEVFTFEEALLAAIEGMKVKKIKKLLKNSEVTIKINFKDKK